MGGALAVEVGRPHHAPRRCVLGRGLLGDAVKRWCRVWGDVAAQVMAMSVFGMKTAGSNRPVADVLRRLQ
jgi:hypothetical protein